MKHNMDLDVIMLQSRILDSMRTSNMDLMSQVLALREGFNKALGQLGDANARAAIKVYEDTLRRLNADGS